MFATGAFSIDGVAVQRFHDSAKENDDVISWIDEPEISDAPDGYVSNNGTATTIHIRSGYTEKDINFVKKMFGLYPKDGIDKVVIEPFEGWEKVLKERGNATAG